MSTQEDYKVQLEVFEGPLDLLLYLIKKDEVDIYNIPIERITTQYMEYLDLMRMLDLNIAGEFIVMAATLMMIKSRMLLPVEERPEILEEEGDDPRWELVKQLIEYKKFKDIASHLQEREAVQEGVFGLGGEPLILGSEDPGMALEDVSLFDLMTALNSVLKRAREEKITEIFSETFTVPDKIDVILYSLKERGQVTFTSLFPETATRHEIACTFLALLELIRMCQIRARQDGRFGEILIVAAEPDPETDRHADDSNDFHDEDEETANSEAGSDG